MSKTPLTDARRMESERDRLRAENAKLRAFALLVSNGMVDAETLRKEARAALAKVKGEA